MSTPFQYDRREPSFESPENLAALNHAEEVLRVAREHPEHIADPEYLGAFVQTVEEQTPIRMEQVAADVQDTLRMYHDRAAAQDRLITVYERNAERELAQHAIRMAAYAAREQSQDILRQAAQAGALQVKWLRPVREACVGIGAILAEAPLDETTPDRVQQQVSGIEEKYVRLRGWQLAEVVLPDVHAALERYAQKPTATMDSLNSMVTRMVSVFSTYS